MRIDDHGCEVIIDLYGDGTDLEAVKKLASMLGGTVTKWPDRPNYNIAADRRRAESDERAGRCVIIR